jgi:hypothetical protein
MVAPWRLASSRLGRGAASRSEGCDRRMQMPGVVLGRHANSA